MKLLSPQCPGQSLLDSVIHFLALATRWMLLSLFYSLRFRESPTLSGTALFWV